jgi:hypothetical protein
MLASGTVISVVLAQALSSARVEPIRIAYHSAPRCPSEAQFLAEVSSRTALARRATRGEAAREFVIDVAERPGASLSGALEIRSVDGVVNRREIAGSDCSEVVSALALMVALAVDPEGALLSAPGPPTSPPAPATPSSDVGSPVATWYVPPLAPDSTPPAVPVSTSQAPGPATSPGLAAPVPSSWLDSAGTGPIRSVGVSPHHAPLLDVDPRRRGRAQLGHWAIGVQGQMLAGVAPSPAIGAGATLDYVSDRERVVAAGLRFALSASTTSPTFAEGVGAQLLWVWARGEVCPFHFRVASALRLAPCLGLDAGFCASRGRASRRPQAIRVHGSRRMSSRVSPGRSVGDGSSTWGWGRKLRSDRTPFDTASGTRRRPRTGFRL